MMWRKVKLGDIAEFSNGINFDKGAYSKGVKLINVSNFGNRFSPEYDSLDEIKGEVVRNNDLLSTGDIVFVRSNGNKELVGRCMLIDNPPEKVTYSGFCIRARFKDTTDHDPVFWTYHFKNMAFRRAMSGTAIGANIQNLSQGRLAVYETMVPNIEGQKRIANILSAYDNLIENNQKQIKLLEEAAQRLYKEWFVDLRFPGYENTAIIDGVPEGWKQYFLSEIVGYEIGGGWGEELVTEKCDKPAYVIRGTDLYGITHGVISEVPYRFHAASNLKSRQLIDGDIIFEVSGGSKTEGVARTTLIRNTILHFLREPIMCASFCKLVRAKEKIHSQLLFDTFQYMRASGKTGEYDKKSASSIVNYRWKDFLTQETILIPNEDLLIKYNALSENMYQLILTKSVEIEKTKEARDRLLPKLMSREIEV